MMKEARNPWTKDIETAERCWNCGKEFREADKVRVVDAMASKVVHDTDACRSVIPSLLVK